MIQTVRQALAPGVVLALLAACTGGATGVPTAQQAVQGNSNRIGDAANSYNLSGEYAGTIKDNQHGTGKAHATLSQAESALGGSLSISGNPTVEYISWTSSGGRVSGTSVFLASSGYCTFSHTSTYNAKTHTLTGSYKNVYGCSGESGTYTLKQNCYFKGTGGNDVRPENGPRPC